MFRKNICLLLSAVLITAFSLQTAQAASKEEKAAALSAKVKSGIAGLGTGQQARVQIKLRDKTKLNGFISEITDENFTVTDLKNGRATQVAYPDVQSVRGNNLSTGAKIAIGAAIGAGVTLLVLWAIVSSLD
ncbi:MAG: hypothetical protein U0Z53_19390 [Blastocatellia bacterium]